MSPTVSEVDALILDLSRQYDQFSSEYSDEKDELRRAEISDLMCFLEYQLARLEELRRSLTVSRKAAAISS